MQPYMMDPDMSTEDISLLFALRTKCVRGIRKDFSGMYASLMCPLCNVHEDSLAALLICELLKHVERNGSKYSDVYAQNVQAQLAATAQHRAFLNERERILEERAAAENGEET